MRWLITTGINGQRMMINPNQIFAIYELSGVIDSDTEKEIHGVEILGGSETIHVDVPYDEFVKVLTECLDKPVE